VEPNAVIYTSLMSAHCASGNWQEAEKILLKLFQLLESAQASNHKKRVIDLCPTDMTFEALFRAGCIAKSSEPIRKWYSKWKLVSDARPIPKEEAKGEGSSSNVSSRELVTFKSALQACVEARDFEMARLVLADYREMKGWCDDYSLRQTTSKKYRVRSYHSEHLFTVEERWSLACDAVLMRCLMHRSNSSGNTVEVVREMLFELQRHESYTPHPLVVAYYERAFQAQWQAITSDLRRN
jgi:pentatricopeptide repeat protein